MVQTMDRGHVEMQYMCIHVSDLALSRVQQQDRRSLQNKGWHGHAMAAGDFENDGGCTSLHVHFLLGAITLLMPAM